MNHGQRLTRTVRHHQEEFTLDDPTLNHSNGVSTCPVQKSLRKLEYFLLDVRWFLEDLVDLLDYNLRPYGIWIADILMSFGTWIVDILRQGFLALRELDWDVAFR